MAKRRKLEAPSTADLSALEEEFRRETNSRNPLSAPIAQVAAEAAQSADLKSQDERAEQARNRHDAERLRQAEKEGLLILDIPLSEIEDGEIIRDRIALDAEEFEELKRSIATHGLRMPIEVFVRANPVGGKRYAVLSGYRRFRAVEALNELWRGERFGSIRAIVREPEAMGGTFVAMVEENEVRSDLSHFERGRIAVLAAKEGAFVNTEAAVDALFASGSKAKRSKIRSFALIFEELGDMLVFPEALREKDGLKIATALRAGAEAHLREALAQVTPESAEEELSVLLRAIDGMGAQAAPKARGGRPKRATGSRDTSAGVRLDWERQGADWVIRLSGGEVDEDLMHRLADQIGAILARG